MTFNRHYAGPAINFTWFLAYAATLTVPTCIGKRKDRTPTLLSGVHMDHQGRSSSQTLKQLPSNNCVAALIGLLQGAF